jgi:hypothetical protein
MKKYIVTSLVAAVAATSAFAGSGKVVKEVIVPEDPCLFRDQELQIDLFGLGDFYKGANDKVTVGAFSGDTRSFSGRPAWGGGVGVNYFFMKYVGIGIEQDLYGRESLNSNSGALAGRRNTIPGNISTAAGDYGYTRWATIGNLFLRYPICQWNLAPYIMVGGGANYGNVPDLQVVPATAVTPGRKYRMAGQGFGHVGGGLEYRITQNIGLFSDARYLFSNVDGLANSQLMWRYGLRFAF